MKLSQKIQTLTALVCADYPKLVELLLSEIRDRDFTPKKNKLFYDLARSIEQENDKETTDRLHVLLDDICPYFQTLNIVCLYDSSVDGIVENIRSQTSFVSWLEKRGYSQSDISVFERLVFKIAERIFYAEDFEPYRSAAIFEALKVAKYPAEAGVIDFALDHLYIAPRTVELDDEKLASAVLFEKRFSPKSEFYNVYKLPARCSDALDKIEQVQQNTATNHLFIIDGEPATGKSVFCNFLIRKLGASNDVYYFDDLGKFASFWRIHRRMPEKSIVYIDDISSDLDFGAYNNTAELVDFIQTPGDSILLSTANVSEFEEFKANIESDYAVTSISTFRLLVDPEIVDCLSEYLPAGAGATFANYAQLAWERMGHASGHYVGIAYRELRDLPLSDVVLLYIVVRYTPSAYHRFWGEVVGRTLSSWSASHPEVLRQYLLQVENSNSVLETISLQRVIARIFDENSEFGRIVLRKILNDDFLIDIDAAKWDKKLDKDLYVATALENFSWSFTRSYGDRFHSFFNFRHLPTLDELSASKDILSLVAIYISLTAARPNNGVSDAEILQIENSIASLINQEPEAASYLYYLARVADKKRTVFFLRSLFFGLRDTRTKSFVFRSLCMIESKNKKLLNVNILRSYVEFVKNIGLEDGSEVGPFFIMLSNSNLSDNELNSFIVLCLEEGMKIFDELCRYCLKNNISISEYTILNCLLSSSGRSSESYLYAEIVDYYGASMPIKIKNAVLNWLYSNRHLEGASIVAEKLYDAFGGRDSVVMTGLKDYLMDTKNSKAHFVVEKIIDNTDAEYYEVVNVWLKKFPNREGMTFIVRSIVANQRMTKHFRLTLALDWLRLLHGGKGRSYVYREIFKQFSADEPLKVRTYQFMQKYDQHLLRYFQI